MAALAWGKAGGQSTSVLPRGVADAADAAVLVGLKLFFIVHG